MSAVIHHVFVSAKADGGDATKVQPSNWNDGLVLSGGVHGNLLMRDTSDATYGSGWSSGLVWDSAVGLITAKLVGGTATTSTLTFQTTTGVGIAGNDFYWLNGNNGATEAMRLVFRAADSLSVLEINNPTYTTANMALTVKAVGANGAWFEAQSPGESIFNFFQPTTGDRYRVGAGLVSTNDFGIKNDIRGITPLQILGGVTGGQVIMQMVGVGSSAIPFPGAGTFGLIFADGTALSSMGANTAGLYADDVGGVVKMHGIHEDGITGVLGLVQTKTDTGDPTGSEGVFVINTFDNTFKAYADGGWRTLASGW